MKRLLFIVVATVALCGCDGSGPTSPTTTQPKAHNNGDTVVWGTDSERHAY